MRREELRLFLFFFSVLYGKIDDMRLFRMRVDVVEMCLPITWRLNLEADLVPTYSSPGYAGSRMPGIASGSFWGSTGHTRHRPCAIHAVRYLPRRGPHVL
ncbi:hypothetical protein F5Y13DRAFT_154352, partial [Hypoxylon sp. FL1857]